MEKLFVLWSCLLLFYNVLFIVFLGGKLLLVDMVGGVLCGFLFLSVFNCDNEFMYVVSFMGFIVNFMWYCG